MWSSSRRAGTIVASLMLLLALAGCTGFRPVYGDGGLDSQRIVVSYAEPNSRVEQIIYKDLALKLGRDGDGPRVTVTTTQSARQLTESTVVRPADRMQVLITAAVTVTDTTGTVVYNGRLSQTADYTNNPQGLANQAAAEDATEKAAHLLADTIRLAILGALSK